VKVDYLSFGKLIKSERLKKFRSSRLFYEKNQLSCTYQHYCRVEKGKLPEINLAIELLKSLSIDLKIGLDTWLTCFMPTEETRSLYVSTNDMMPNLVGDGPSALKSVLVVNRFQANFILDNPLSYDIMCYLNTHLADKNTEENIISALSLSESEASKLLAEMYEICILDKEGPYYTMRDHFVIPRENKLDELQHLIFQKSYDNYFDSKDPEKMRLTLFCNLSKNQARMISDKMRQLRNWIWEMEKSPQNGDEDVYPYFLGMFNAQKTYFDN